MNLFKKNFLLFVALYLCILLSGCGNGEAVDEADQYISTIEQMDIPNDIKFIGLGEATQGMLNFKS